MRGPNVKSVEMTVLDNLFDDAKADVLYGHIAASGIREFTFNNEAGAYDWNGVQYSSFDLNMKRIRMQPGLAADIRWEGRGTLLC